jgi:hypothetical protein
MKTISKKIRDAQRQRREDSSGRKILMLTITITITPD